MLFRLTCTLLTITTIINIAKAQTAPFNVIMATDVEQATLVNNSLPSNNFVLHSSKFDCSLNTIYTYTQNQTLYLLNSPYYLVVSGFNQSIEIDISTVYSNFEPSPSRAVCNPPSCEIQIFNNCPNHINSVNYFDRITLTFSNLNTQLSYYVICNQGFMGNTFEWGLVIQIVAICILVYIIALYSKAWSLGGQGIAFNIVCLVVVSGVLVVGALIGFFTEQGINYCLIVLSFFLGILGVGICTNQLLFLLRFNFLMYKILSVKSLQLRVLEVVSLCVGIGACVGWWFSDHNVILNDILCICISISFIKIFKFTNLKIALLTFAVSISIQIVYATVLFVVNGQSYNDLFLNKYNYPFQLQIPTINPVYNQKCAWLPFTAIVFPGMLLSYLRRFDTSRSTNLYLITAAVTLFIGGIAWMFLSLVTPVELAFGLVSEPCMFGLIVMFAYRRREIRVLWDGKFYDEQFGDRNQLKLALQMITVEARRDSVKTIDSRIIEELKERGDTFTVRGQSDANTIRSKFLREMPQSPN